jgi:hypothetical protein
MLVLQRCWGVWAVTAVEVRSRRAERIRIDLGMRS